MACLAVCCSHTHVEYCVPGLEGSVSTTDMQPLLLKQARYSGLVTHGIR